MKLYICSDDFNRENVVCKCRKLRAKKYNYGLYTFEMKNDVNGIAVYIRKRYFIFQTQFMCISDNMLKTAIVVPDVFKTADSIIELYFCPNLFDEREAEAYEFNKNVEWIYKNSNSMDIYELDNLLNANFDNVNERLHIIRSNKTHDRLAR